MVILSLVCEQSPSSLLQIHIVPAGVYTQSLLSADFWTVTTEIRYRILKMFKYRYKGTLGSLPYIRPSSQEHSTSKIQLIYTLYHNYYRLSVIPLKPL